MRAFSRNRHRFPTDSCPSRHMTLTLEREIVGQLIEARSQGLEKWQSRQNIVDLFVEFQDSAGETFRDPIEWPATTDPNQAVRSVAANLHDRAFRDRLIINKIVSKIYA